MPVLRVKTVNQAREGTGIDGDRTPLRSDAPTRGRRLGQACFIQRHIEVTAKALNTIPFRLNVAY